MITGWATPLTRFVYDGWQVIGEINVDSGGTIGDIETTYAWGLDASGSLGGVGGIGGLLAAYDLTGTSDNILAVGYDGRGNISNVHDMTAQNERIGYAEYTAYGETVRVEGVMAGSFAFGYQTKYNINYHHPAYGAWSLTLHDFGHRWYDSKHGRFINRDPIGDAGGTNTIYSYLDNDPINALEYLGLWQMSVQEILGGAGTGFQQSWAFGWDGDGDGEEDDPPIPLPPFNVPHPPPDTMEEFLFVVSLNTLRNTMNMSVGQSRAELTRELNHEGGGVREVTDEDVDNYLACVSQAQIDLARDLSRIGEIQAASHNIVRELNANREAVEFWDRNVAIAEITLDAAVATGVGVVARHHGTTFIRARVLSSSRSLDNLIAAQQRLSQIQAAATNLGSLNRSYRNAAAFYSITGGLAYSLFSSSGDVSGSIQGSSVGELAGSSFGWGDAARISPTASPGWQGAVLSIAASAAWSAASEELFDFADQINRDTVPGEAVDRNAVRSTARAHARFADAMAECGKLLE